MGILLTGRAKRHHYQTAFIVGLILAPALSFAGALNLDVTQNNIQETICVPGHTKTIRPPTSKTNKIKQDMMRERNLDPSITPYVALDHIIPLALGGHPTDKENLQLISHRENARKSIVDKKLQCLVCTGRVTLEEAQRNMQGVYLRFADEKCVR